MNIPRTVAVNGSYVFVGSLGKILLFDRSNLQFVRYLNVPNNPLSMVSGKDRLFLGMTTYPATEQGVFMMGFDGKELGAFYEHQEDKVLKMPFLAMGRDRLFVMSRERYHVDVFNVQGKKLKPPTLTPPPLYRPVVPVKKFEKEFGRSLAGYARWRLQWSESQQIALVQNRFLFLCFKELQPDLRSNQYFVSVYDLHRDQRIVAWKSTGRLLCGGDTAWFLEEGEERDYISAYRLEMVIH